MTDVLVEEKQVVAPGALLAKGMEMLPGQGAYRKDDSIYANKVGLVSITGRAIKLIPLSGKYLPKRDDVIIAKVFDIMMMGWRVETNSAYSAMLNVREASNSFIAKHANLSRILDIDDYISCKITNVTSQKLIDISMRGPGLRKLTNGQILSFTPAKFPRMIGRAGSMVSMIKQATGCNIIVGQNGLVWVSGEPQNEVIAAQAISMIEQEAHISGLTEKVKKFLESKGLKIVPREPRNDTNEDNTSDEENGEEK